MSALGRRLHILLDEDRYARLEAEAKERGSSVAAVVRLAIDHHFDEERDLARRAEAARKLLASADEGEGPAETWDEMMEARAADIARMAGEL
ncbi:ribbon-helix-helix CopG family protein [Knoellia remsis]|uniref:Ribbon-helix-helix CopG family protein n=1 Tax=Knoellia remsis TaxID=407159 RepID=A0A2T0UR68_9MICO|nr:ribbon-helix-helix protein, CopG family [Knoellia remsis]PRY60327.1 ribbon-helix-helix CopG family protein [Knoellia remsis]